MYNQLKKIMRLTRPLALFMDCFHPLRADLNLLPDNASRVWELAAGRPVIRPHG